MAFVARVMQTWRFLRYGPTQLDEARARASGLEQQLSAQAASAKAGLERLEGLRANVEGLGAGLETLKQGWVASQHELATWTNNLAGSLANASREVAAVKQELPGMQQELAAVKQSLTAVEQTLAQRDGEFRRESDAVRSQLSALSAALDRAQGADANSTEEDRLPPSAEAAEDGFYPELEREFRGTREDVRDRLTVYEPWVTGLPPGPVGDLGCGRGEWMHLLGEWSVPARGVDLNTLHVEPLRAQGLDVEHGDAVKWLQSQPDNSLAAVTSFHVVEHLPFGLLLRLIQEARRVLQPGGRLILETPNPENLEVVTQTFWLDPTHLRPIPPALLELVVRYCGLEVETTLRLNPPPGDGQDIADATLRDLMTRGRDYAVIARKPSVQTA